MNSGQYSTPQAHEALISLVIPVYNVEKYIAACLESALRQTLADIEIICVDDCGTDQSWTIVEAYARRDPRIKLVRNERNLGIAATRNAGLRQGTAPYIMFLDSDDTCEDTFCETMHRAIVSSGADLAVCGTQITYESDSSCKEADENCFSLRYEGLHSVHDDMVSACNVYLWNKIFRRELIERGEIRFPEGLLYEDAFFVNAYMAHAQSVMFVKEKLYRYRRREGSIMNQTFARQSAMSLDHLRIAFALRDYFLKCRLLEKKYAYYCRFFLEYVNHALHHSPSRETRRQALNMAGDYARAHLPSTPQLDGATFALLEQVKTIAHAEGTLWRVETEPFFRRWRLLGLPLYAVKYTPSRIKHYLFGLQIRKQKYPTAPCSIPG